MNAKLHVSSKWDNSSLFTVETIRTKMVLKWMVLKLYLH